MQLTGKTAVITGAAGDIGRATAARFAQAGARLALLDRDAKRLDDVCAALEGTVLRYAIDITNEADLADAAKAIAAEMGQVDIVFANAGIEQSHTPVTDLAREEFDQVISVNLTGAYLTAKQFLPVMSEGGSLMFTSSIAALMGFAGLAAYSASKAGVVGLMRSVSLDAAQRGIRCNSIHPGSVKSAMLERSAKLATGRDDSTPEFFAMLASMARLNRLVEPDDVAALAQFLGSDSSRMITGQSIAVDGGTVP